ncbi:hypothetical protein [Nocardia arizonensis]|uniref:hypothetical protein n=1 Tax=Nocardia arizonensis TaxID=1141647 RepID=UPI0006D014F0|nr:hypothetical protein [Nocardia arizonensis]
MSNDSRPDVLIPVPASGRSGFPRQVWFVMPRILQGLALALVVAAGIGSFTFTATLAKAAGVPEYLTWLWPVVVGLTVAQVAYTYIVLFGLSEAHDRLKPLHWFYLLLMAGFAVASVVGNVTVISRNPTDLGTGETMTVVAVPPVFLLLCVCGYVLLDTIIPNQIEASLREKAATHRPTHYIGRDLFDRPAPPDVDDVWWKQDGSDDNSEETAESDTEERSAASSETTAGTGGDR